MGKYEQYCPDLQPGWQVEEFLFTVSSQLEEFSCYYSFLTQFQNCETSPKETFHNLGRNVGLCMVSTQKIWYSHLIWPWKSLKSFQDVELLKVYLYDGWMVEDAIKLCPSYLHKLLHSWSLYSWVSLRKLFNEEYVTGEFERFLTTWHSWCDLEEPGFYNFHLIIQFINLYIIWHLLTMHLVIDFQRLSFNLKLLIRCTPWHYNRIDWKCLK